MKRLSACLFLAILLAGCGEEELVLPEGIQTVSGYLQSVPFSLQRRGTHALLTASGGTMIAYAESSTVNLRALEGQDVQLEGLLEKNINAKDSPVFVVQKVLQGSDEKLRPWKIPALGLSVNLPASWKGTIKGASATFSESGALTPLLSITKGAVARPAQPLYGALPVSSVSTDEVLMVGLRKATVRMDGGSWIVRAASPSAGGSETVFTFAPETSALWRNVLKTVEFSVNIPATSARSSPAPKPSVPGGQTGSSRAGGDGAACGGIAGILCPKGFYCRITDAVSESGICTAR